MTCKYNETISVRYGINSALISEYLWREAETNGKTICKRNWTRCSQKNIMGIFPFLGEKATRNALKRLLYAGIIVRAEKNESRFDRTFSYSFTDYGKALMLEENLTENTEEIFN